MKSSPHGQRSRSLATQTAIMQATERLIAMHGAHNISIKHIVHEAGQKNESALQYHFKNLEGLISSIHRTRGEQIHQKRSELLEVLESSRRPLKLRDLCGLMVFPTFLLAKSDSSFRQYVTAFSQEIALADDSALSKASKSGAGGESGVRLGKLLRAALPHLDSKTYKARMDIAVRACSAAMGNRLRKREILQGPSADFFINNLIDSLEGLLNAPKSEI